MCGLWTIYKYEMKKLVGRKLLWISTFLCIICTIISVFAGLFGTYYETGEPIESNYEAFQKDRVYRKALSGKYIDEYLLRETVEGYRRIPETESQYTLTDEYETYARPYSDIFNMIRSWTGMILSEIQNWEVDEDALYEARMQYWTLSYIVAGCSNSIHSIEYSIGCFWKMYLSAVSSFRKIKNKRY